MKSDKHIPFNSDKPTRADAVRNRRLLLETANHLFEIEGVEEVTMSAIAREAGVGKGTLYRHFNDKAELCHALLDEDMRVFQQETLTKMRGSSDAQATLKWFLQSAANYVVGHSALLLEAANQSRIEMLHHPAHVWWRQTIHGLLSHLQPEGDIEYMADILYVMLDVQTIRFQRHGQGYDVERIIAGLHMTLECLLGHH